MKFKLALVALLALPFPALAQVPSPPPVAALSGQVSLSVSSVSSRVALPSTAASATAITLYNSGTVDAFFATGSSSIVATSGGTCAAGSAGPSCKIPAGSWLTIYSSDPYLAAITASSTTTLTVYQGNGPVQLGAAGAAGGGGGGNVTVTAPLGAQTAAASVATTVNGALPAGTNLMGKVGIDQTTPGTTNAVSAAQNGTWNVTNVSGTVSLPTGASTAALQPTNSAIGATTSGQTGTLHMGAVTTAAPSYTTAQSDPLSLTTAGALRSDMTSVNGVTTLTSNGASGTGSQRINVANDNTAIANWGQGATGSAAPTGAQYKGLLAKTALPAAGTDGNLIGAMADKFGRQVTRGAPRELLVTVGTSTAGTSGTLLAAQGAGVFSDLYRLTLSNSSATTVAVTVSDGTNSYTNVVPAGSTIYPISGPVDSATPAATANTAWSYTVSSGVTSIFFTAQFVNNK